MPTVFTHPAVPITLAFACGRKIISWPLLAAGIAASILPDLDIIAFRIGIPYAAEFGHRGFSHSLVFAALAAAAGGLFLCWSGSTFRGSFWFLFAAVASHSILDACTTGGLGIAFLWPWSNERYFAPLQFIQVSPLGISRFLSQKGAAVLRSEFFWVWLPCISIATMTMFFRRSFSQIRYDKLEQ